MAPAWRAPDSLGPGRSPGRGIPRALCRLSQTALSQGLSQGLSQALLSQRVLRNVTVITRMPGFDRAP
eukprot:4260175-Heterocapsa_arctica.AAC.1